MGYLREGDRRWFSPHALGDETVRLAAGRVEVLELVDPESGGLSPIYRVRNVDNGRAAMAFGDELSTT